MYLDTLDAVDAPAAAHGVGVAAVLGAPHAGHLRAPPQPRQRHGGHGRGRRVGAAAGARAARVQDVLQTPRLAAQHLRSEENIK